MDEKGDDSSANVEQLLAIAELLAEKTVIEQQEDNIATLTESNNDGSPTRKKKRQDQNKSLSRPTKTKSQKTSPRRPAKNQGHKKSQARPTTTQGPGNSLSTETQEQSRSSPNKKDKKKNMPVTKIVKKRKPLVYKCRKCHRAYLTAQSLKAHIGIEHKGKRVTCYICGNQLKWEGNLTRHLFNVHNIGAREKRKVKRKCDSCSMSFRTNAELYNHMKYEHDIPRPYHCTKCDETFESWLTLSNHEFLHLELVRYTCSVCLLRFRRRTRFREHCEKYGHPQTSVENDSSDLACFRCKRNFGNYGSFQKHVRKSLRSGSCEKVQKYVCQLCNMKFTYQWQLKRHYQDCHIGYIPQPKKSRRKPTLSCAYCPEKVKGKLALRNHEFAHKGITPHKCSGCNYKTFSDCMYGRHLMKCELRKQAACSVAKDKEDDFIAECKRKRYARDIARRRERFPERPVRVPKTYTCTYCSEQITGSRAWTDHRSAHIRKMKHKCSSCGHEQLSDKGFCGHLVKCELRKKAKPSVEIEKEDDFIKEYRRKNNLVRRAHKDAERQAEEAKKPAQSKNITVMYYNKTYTCTYCSKQITGLRAWKNHKSTHKPKIMHKCSSCGHELFTNRRYYGHLMNCEFRNKAEHSVEIEKEDDFIKEYRRKSNLEKRAYRQAKKQAQMEAKKSVQEPEKLAQWEASNNLVKSNVVKAMPSLRPFSEQHILKPAELSQQGTTTAVDIVKSKVVKAMPSLRPFPKQQILNPAELSQQEEKQTQKKAKKQAQREAGKKLKHITVMYCNKESETFKLNDDGEYKCSSNSDVKYTEVPYVSKMLKETSHLNETNSISLSAPASTTFVKDKVQDEWIDFDPAELGISDAESAESPVGVQVEEASEDNLDDSTGMVSRESVPAEFIKQEVQDDCTNFEPEEPAYSIVGSAEVPVSMKGGEACQDLLDASTGMLSRESLPAEFIKQEVQEEWINFEPGEPGVSDVGSAEVSDARTGTLLRASIPPKLIKQEVQDEWIDFDPAELSEQEGTTPDNISESRSDQEHSVHVEKADMSYIGMPTPDNIPKSGTLLSPDQIQCAPLEPADNNLYSSEPVRSHEEDESIEREGGVLTMWSTTLTHLKDDSGDEQERDMDVSNGSDVEEMRKQGLWGNDACSVDSSDDEGTRKTQGDTCTVEYNHGGDIHHETFRIEVQTVNNRRQGEVRKRSQGQVEYKKRQIIQDNKSSIEGRYDNITHKTQGKVMKSADIDDSYMVIETFHIEVQKVKNEVKCKSWEIHNYAAEEMKETGGFKGDVDSQYGCDDEITLEIEADAVETVDSDEIEILPPGFKPKKVKCKEVQTKKNECKKSVWERYQDEIKVGSGMHVHVEVNDKMYLNKAPDLFDWIAMEEKVQGKPRGTVSQQVTTPAVASESAVLTMTTPRFDANSFLGLTNALPVLKQDCVLPAPRQQVTIPAVASGSSLLTMTTPPFDANSFMGVTNALPVLKQDYVLPAPQPNGLPTIFSVVTAMPLSSCPEQRILKPAELNQQGKTSPVNIVKSNVVTAMPLLSPCPEKRILNPAELNQQGKTSPVNILKSSIVTAMPSLRPCPEQRKLKPAELNQQGKTTPVNVVKSSPVTAIPLLRPFPEHLIFKPAELNQQGKTTPVNIVKSSIVTTMPSLRPCPEQRRLKLAELNVQGKTTPVNIVKSSIVTSVPLRSCPEQRIMNPAELSQQETTTPDNISMASEMLRSDQEQSVSMESAEISQKRNTTSGSLRDQAATLNPDELSNQEQTTQSSRSLRSDQEHDAILEPAEISKQEKTIDNITNSSGSLRSDQDLAVTLEPAEPSHQDQTALDTDITKSSALLRSDQEKGVSLKPVELSKKEHITPYNILKPSGSSRSNQEQSVTLEPAELSKQEHITPCNILTSGSLTTDQETLKPAELSKHEKTTPDNIPKPSGSLRSNQEQCVTLEQSIQGPSPASILESSESARVQKKQVVQSGKGGFTLWSTVKTGSDDS